MSAYRSPGHVEPTLTPEEERKYYASIPLVGAPANVPAFAALFVGLTILVVLAALLKTVYDP